MLGQNGHKFGNRKGGQRVINGIMDALKSSKRHHGAHSDIGGHPTHPFRINVFNLSNCDHTSICLLGIMRHDFSQAKLGE